MKIPAHPRDLRFFQLLDDHLEPTLRRLDFVLLAKTDRYIGEGFYIVDNALPEQQWIVPAAYYISGGGVNRDRPILMRIPNALYRDKGQSFSHDDFNQIVVGKVAMTCCVQDRDLLPSTISLAA